MCIDYDFEKERLFDLEKIKIKCKELTEALEEYKVYHDACADEHLQEWVAELIQKEYLKLYHYSYSDIYYDRCGGQDGSESGLVSPAPYDMIFKRIKEYAYANKGNFCQHKFFETLNALGATYSDSRPHGFGNVTEYTFPGEDKLLSSEEYAKLQEEKKLAEQRKRQEAEDKVRLEREKQEREQYERLKVKFG